MAYEYHILQWFLFFYIYCLIGWCFESAYVSCREKRLVNRGFMRGPFLPLYGSGAIMMLVVSMPFRDNIFFTYIAGVLGATLLEYITGVCMEALFKVRYWDYSNQKYQYKGYICLSSSIAWGFLTILMTRVIHKPIENFVLSIPAPAFIIIVLLLTISVAADLTWSFKTALDLRNILVSMEKAKADLFRMQKRLDVIAAVLDDAKEGLAEEFVQRKELFIESLDSHMPIRKIYLEELAGGIEEQLIKLKNKIQEKPAEYVGSLKEELAEIRGKYMAQSEHRKKFRIRRDFHKRNLILGNPSMKSLKYDEALEELKKELSANKDRTDKGNDRENKE